MAEEKEEKKMHPAKVFLSVIPKTDRLINRLMNTVAELRSSLTSTGTDMQSDKVQTSGPKDTLGNTVAKIVDLEREINNRIDELCDLKYDILARISRMPDLDQQNVLIARYVQGLKWEKIAKEMNFSLSQIYKLHGKGLNSFLEFNPDIQAEETT